MEPRSSAAVKELAQALDIHSFMLSRWRIGFREGKFGMPASNKAQKQESKLLEQYELKRLNCPVAEQEHENDVLKSGNVAWRRNSSKIPLRRPVIASSSVVDCRDQQQNSGGKTTTEL